MYTIFSISKNEKKKRSSGSDHSTANGHRRQQKKQLLYYKCSAHSSNMYVLHCNDHKNPSTHTHSKQLFCEWALARLEHSQTKTKKILNEMNKWEKYETKQISRCELNTKLRLILSFFFFISYLLIYLYLNNICINS